MSNEDSNETDLKVEIQLCLVDEVMHNVIDEVTAIVYKVSPTVRNVVYEKSLQQVVREEATTWTIYEGMDNDIGVYEFHQQDHRVIGSCCEGRQERQDINTSHP